MGETVIHTVPDLDPSDQTIASLSNRITPLFALDNADERDVKNWLGDQLDNIDESGGKPSEQEIKIIGDAAGFLIHQHTDKTALTYEANSFVLMLVLRERWPVGSKAKLRDIAARAGATFGYHVVVCPPQPLPDAADHDALSKAEAASLTEMLPHLKRARKQFASSSGLQQFLQNA